MTENDVVPAVDTYLVFGAGRGAQSQELGYNEEKIGGASVTELRRADHILTKPELDTHPAWTWSS